MTWLANQPDGAIAKKCQQFIVRNEPHLAASNGRSAPNGTRLASGRPNPLGELSDKV